MADGALAGIKVLDLSTLYPAPLLAAMLGDLGADVVKVEPPDGDPIRRVGALAGGEPRAHRYANRNKRSVALDASTDDGLATLEALTSVADVVVVNQTDAQLGRWRCTYAEIAARNPGAIVVSLSAFGRTGPWAERGGNGSIAEGFGGFAFLNGSADGAPTLPSLALGDTVGAIVALNGVLAALTWRASAAGNGRGQLVDASLAESVLALLGATFAGWKPGEPVPERLGSRIAHATPRNVYRTADDRYVVVSAPTDAQVARVLTLLGITDDEARARFATATARTTAAADELDQRVAAWIAARPLADAIAALDTARLPCAPVQTLDDLLANAQLMARGSLVPLGDGDGDGTYVPAPHPQLSRTPATIRTAGRAEPGADTDEVLAAWLPSRTDG
ncbi:MAG TPA: CoA transferase [Acidimicrobiia bacterium]|jgi:formyl-CoA transferase